MAKKKASDMKRLGHYAFILGIVLAAIVALIPWFYSSAERKLGALVLFAVLGVIVGLLNITQKEVTEFLIAALVLLVTFGMTALAFAIIPVFGEFLSKTWANAINFIAPAAIIVAIKAVVVLAEKK